MAATSLKAMAEDKANSDVKKKTTFQANPLRVNEKQGFNKRNYVDPEVEAQIESFAQSYIASVFVPAWVVWVGDDGEIIVLEGHLRRRGCLRAIERGADIPFVDCVQFKGTWSEAIQLMLLSQAGLKFKPLEFALGVLDLKNEGHDNAEIALMVRRTPARIEQLLLLATAHADVHELVRSGKVDAEAAIISIRDHRDNAAAALQGLHTEAQSQGKNRVTRSAVRGPSLPPKVMSSVIVSLESAVGRFSNQTRLKLAEFEGLTAEQLKGKTLEVDVESLLELIKAQGEILEVRAKRDAAAAARVAAGAQQHLDMDAQQHEEAVGGATDSQETGESNEPALAIDEPQLSPEELAALRVFGGTLTVQGVQVRALVATYTQKDAAKLTGLTVAEIRGLWTQTSDEAEIRAAHKHPQKVVAASSMSSDDYSVLQ